MLYLALNIHIIFITIYQITGAIMQNNKYAIVAGNAPSLAEIDYNRLPLDYDVFRCNQFYFEDKYYLGKNIKAVTFATQTFAEQIYTTLELNRRSEYNIESIFIPNHHLLPKRKREFELENLMTIFKS